MRSEAIPSGFYATGQVAQPLKFRLHKAASCLSSAGLSSAACPIPICMASFGSAHVNRTRSLNDASYSRFLRVLSVGSHRHPACGFYRCEFVRSRDDAELIDARAVGLPMLDRMYKEYEPGCAPPKLEELAIKIRFADAFIFVTGEYNWGVQPGLKKPYRPFSRRVVLATRCDRQLFHRPTGRRACGSGLAWNAVGNGHDRDLKQAYRRTHSSSFRRRRKAAG